VLVFVGLLSLALMLWGEEVAGVFQSVIVALAAAFCGMTLALQARSKRARPDATQRFWRLAMFCGLATCLLWASAHMLPALDSLDNWPLAFGVLLFAGGFMSVIVGMLYKIVPFLVWLHLQNYGQGRVVAPNMKMVLPEATMLRHYRIHLGTCLLLLAATLLPSWLARPAGLMLALSGGILGYNLLLALGVYRRHLRLVDQTLAASAAGGSLKEEQ
jgi:predicted membrane channel-forming protein YqfA (hemolysin III family)